MGIIVLAVDKKPPAYVQTATDIYLKRLNVTPYTSKLIEIASSNKATEAKGLFGKVPQKAIIIALCVSGQTMDSLVFSRWLRQRIDSGLTPCFIIGGADGLEDAVLERSAYKLSLSPMTLPHALARVVLFEQLYRAMTLAHNHPYHH